MSAGVLRNAVAAGTALAVLVPAMAAGPNVVQSITYGEIVSVRRVVVEQRGSGTGSYAGATVGAVAGYALADGRDRWLGSLIGGALGGLAGGAAGKAARKKKGWELIIRLESGEEIGIQEVGKKQRFQPGDRVRLMSGGGKTEVVKIDD